MAKPGAAVTITSNSKKIEKVLKKFPDQLAKESKQELKSPANKTWADLISDSRKNLTPRTGALSRGYVKPEITGTKFKDLQVIFINEQLYADIQEKGGTIKPKNARFLAIPLEGAKTAAGVPRFSSPLRESSAPPMFFAKGVLFSQGPGGSARLNLVPMFALVKQVKIPPRLMAAETIKKNERLFLAAIDKAATDVWNKKV